MAIHGGGHALPQPYVRMPKIRTLILGPTAEEPNGPAMIWDLFERQTRRQPSECQMRRQASQTRNFADGRSGVSLT